MGFTMASRPERRKMYDESPEDEILSEYDSSEENDLVEEQKSMGVVESFTP